jgi:adenylylsulfate kinase-like enzyme
MSTVHLILQGKGGVGKSVVATLLAQYLRDKGHSREMLRRGSAESDSSRLCRSGCDESRFDGDDERSNLGAVGRATGVFGGDAAEHQKLLSEFEAALGRNQIAWNE